MRPPPVNRFLLTAVTTTVLCLISMQVNAEEQVQVDMEGMSIIGSKESPKALFIVPWKEAESPLTPERPLNSLLNNDLQPVDPEVFRRHLQYFDQLHTSTLKTRGKVNDNN